MFVCDQIKDNDHVYLNTLWLAAKQLKILPHTSVITVVLKMYEALKAKYSVNCLSINFLVLEQGGEC